MDICIFCKSDLADHCSTRGCRWRQCTTCGTISWPERRHLLRHGQRVAWPYKLPDTG